MVVKFFIIYFLRYLKFCPKTVSMESSLIMQNFLESLINIYLMYLGSHYCSQKRVF